MSLHPIPFCHSCGPELLPVLTYCWEIRNVGVLCLPEIQNWEVEGLKLHPVNLERNSCSAGLGLEGQRNLQRKHHRLVQVLAKIMYDFRICPFHLLCVHNHLLEYLVCVLFHLIVYLGHIWQFSGLTYDSTFLALLLNHMGLGNWKWIGCKQGKPYHLYYCSSPFVCVSKTLLVASVRRWPYTQN